MTSACTIRRRSTAAAQNETTGLEDHAWTVVASVVPIRLGGADRGGAGSRTLTIGGVETTLAVRVAHLPATFDDLADGDLIEITSGENSGAVLQVVEATWQDQATARRVPVFEVQRPTEWG